MAVTKTGNHLTPLEKGFVLRVPTLEIRTRGRGVALSSSDRDAPSQALAAMGSIEHVRDSYSVWVNDDGYFQSRMDDLLAILWLPDLEEVFPQLCALLGISPTPALPSDWAAEL